MKPSTLFFIFGVAIFASGCASTDKIVLDNSKRAPTTNIDIYKDRNTPVRSHKEIAELSYLGPREDELKALSRFIGEAKQMGGNGIIFTPVYGGTKGGGTLFQTEAWVFKASVIVYQQESTQSDNESTDDKSLESKLVGHWQSVSVNVKSPGAASPGAADTIIFSFLPELQFSETSMQNGKAYVMSGRYVVRNGKLILTDAVLNPDDSINISLEGDTLKMSGKTGSESIVLKRIP